MKSLLLFNDTAGLAEHLRTEIEDLAQDDRCELVSSNEIENGNQILERARRHGCRRLVVAGGDGTLHRVINQLAPHFGDLEIGLVPCGTGNDFARSIGARQDHLRKLCTDDSFGRIERVDLMKIQAGETRYCINAATGGLGGEISSQIHKVEKRRWGPFAYWMSALGKLTDLHAFQIELQCDKERLEVKAYGVVISNGRFVGGGFPIAPGATLNDGWLDITVVPVLPAFDLLTAGLNFAVGLPEMSSRIQHHIAHRIHLKSNPPMSFSIDGEGTKTMAASFEVIPQVLKVVVSNQAPGLQPVLSRLEPRVTGDPQFPPELGWAAPMGGSN